MYIEQSTEYVVNTEVRYERCRTENVVNTEVRYSYGAEFNGTAEGPN